MAVVLACADQARIVVKCDGRQISEHGAVLSEDQVWYTKLSSTCIVGHIGDSMVCEMLIIALKQNLAALSDPSVEEIVKQLQMILQSTSDTTEGCSFIIAGADEVGTHLFGMSYQDGYKEILDKSPKEEDVVCENLIIGPSALASAQSFSQMYDQKKSIESNMNAYIRYIGTMDPTVNDHIVTEKIRLG